MCYNFSNNGGSLSKVSYSEIFKRNRLEIPRTLLEEMPSQTRLQQKMVILHKTYGQGMRIGLYSEE